MWLRSHLTSVTSYCVFHHLVPKTPHSVQLLSNFHLSEIRWRGQSYSVSSKKGARLYLMFRLHLGKEFTHPIGYPDRPQFRLIDMFTSGTHNSVQEAITSLFTTPSSSLRVLIATIAFGMRINPSDVHYVIHCNRSIICSRSW